VTLSKEKIIEIDKKVRKKLQEEGYAINTSTFANPFNDISMKKVEEQKSVQTENKNAKERALTYEEWMNRKNAEAMYKKMMLEAEKQEQEKMRYKEEKEKKKEKDAR
jgi:hypothetical protein